MVVVDEDGRPSSIRVWHIAQAFCWISRSRSNCFRVRPYRTSLCVWFHRRLAAGSTILPWTATRSANRRRARAIARGVLQLPRCPGVRAQWAFLRGIHLPQTAPAIPCSLADMVTTTVLSPEPVRSGNSSRTRLLLPALPLCASAALPFHWSGGHTGANQWFMHWKLKRSFEGIQFSRRLLAETDSVPRHLRSHPGSATLSTQASIRGSPNRAMVLLSTNRVTAEMRSPDSVSTIMPCARNTPACSSCR
jgi:hypothetical protein